MAILGGTAFIAAIARAGEPVESKVSTVFAIAGLNKSFEMHSNFESVLDDIRGTR